MDCPACLHNLTRLVAGEVEIDICKGGCGGIWFDRDELFHFDEQHEFDISQAIGTDRNPDPQIAKDLQKDCPRCAPEPLVRQFLDHHNKIEVDQCWSCGGVWLDYGEIDMLREQYATHEERAKAANSFANSILDQHRDALHQLTKEEIDRYNEENSNAFRAAVHVVKKLLGG